MLFKSILPLILPELCNVVLVTTLNIDYQGLSRLYTAMYF